MMRIAVILSCLLLLLLPATAVPDATGAYLAARDRYIAQFKLQPPRDDPADTREARALADLDTRLMALIPPWHAPGFTGDGRTTLSLLHQDLGFGTLDGLAYGARGTEVIVTTPVLLQRWLADHKDRWHESLNVPQATDAAIRSSQFWTFAYGDDNGWLFFGDVSVTVSGGAATAQLAADTDSGAASGGPKYLLVTVARGSRFFVARQQLRPGTPPQEQAQALADLLH